MLCYIPSRDSSNIRSLPESDPLKPGVLHQNLFDFDVHNTFIWQQGDKVYMILVDFDLDAYGRDVKIADITHPSKPKLIAATGFDDWPDDIAEEFGFCGETFIHDAWVQENGDKVVAYLAYWDAGLVLLDVT